jgi:uncharacterized protein YjbI with pentapeptide repeats
MANEEQLAILKKGVAVWNQWREENPDAKIDTTDVNLSGVNLSGANLSGANLSGANLRRVRLVDANFIETNLTAADLLESNLGRANLKAANLRRTNLMGANLQMADLSQCDLGEAQLDGVKFDKAILTGTNFLKAEVGFTRFGNSDLSEAIGLDDVVHRAPSSIAIDTFAPSKGKIPEPFLRGCGLSDADIEYSKLSNPDLNNEAINKILYKIYDLRASQALQISPLFISYSHNDSTFVDKLESSLNEKGVRFWRDIHDMKSGRIEEQIDRAMRLNPTVLLILSKVSLQSDWVEHEVRTARVLEKEMKRDVLCPVALDDSWKISPWSKRIMEQIMEYNILDFSEWKDDTKFTGIFNRLIGGLELFYK